MQITNGTVEYSRTVKPADYESKAAKVVLSFAVDEGEASPDAVVARVFDMAMGEVHRRLGLNGHVVKVEEPKRGVQLDPEIVTALKAKKGAAAAPQENPTSNPPGDTTTPASPPPSPEPTVADPLAIVAPATAAVSDAVVDVTDSDLHTAVHQALDRGVTAIQVRNMTDTFTGVVGQSMRTLPQDQRPAFLTALKELQPE